MSGIAMAASTIPGSVATLTSCSRERSCSMAANSSASANTRAGTRMPGRAPTGISHSSSPMRSGARSDIEDHGRAVPGIAGLEGQPVIGHGLDERWRLAQPAANDAPELPLRQLERLQRQGLEAFRLREEGQLLEPADQEGWPVGGGHPDRAPLVPVPLHAQQLCQSGKRVREDLALAVGPYFELHLGRVIDPAIHAGMIAPPGARVTPRRPG